MVPQKEPLSPLVLPQSYLLIGKARGENNRYWLPHRVKLTGRMSGGVRKDCILHPLLPRCCQNSLSCHCSIPFYPAHLTPSSRLLSWIAKEAFSSVQIFISACETYSQMQQNRSSGLSHTPPICRVCLTFHFHPSLRGSRHLGVRFRAFMYFWGLFFFSFSHSPWTLFTFFSCCMVTRGVTVFSQTLYVTL